MFTYFNSILFVDKCRNILGRDCAERCTRLVYGMRIERTPCGLCEYMYAVSFDLARSLARADKQILRAPCVCIYSSSVFAARGTYLYLISRKRNTVKKVGGVDWTRRIFHGDRSPCNRVALPVVRSRACVRSVCHCSHCTTTSNPFVAHFANIHIACVRMQNYHHAIMESGACAVLCFRHILKDRRVHR